MAVIKIVPMPGAKGEKGDTGAAGQDAASFISSGTWNTDFLSLSGIEGTFEHSDMNLGSYYKVGDLVFFEINIATDGTNFTDWTAGDVAGWHLKLPFEIADNWQDSVSPTQSRMTVLGRMYGSVDNENGIVESNESGNVPLYGVLTPHAVHGSVIYLYTSNEDDINTNYDSLTPVTSSHPWNFAGQAADAVHYFRITLSGTYLSKE